ncbi:MAG: DUF4249 family protein [Cytophagales bacterium]|nr:DUF4249 family protein [Cytophagales bacterium]
MRRFKHFLVVTILLCGQGCSEDTFLTEENFVVEAFLFARQPVNQVTIKRLRPLTGDPPPDVLIPDAAVSLKKNGVTYTLIYNAQTGKYAYTGVDLQVNPGDHFELQVVKGSRVAFAETIVPQPAADVMISGNKIIIPAISIRFGIVEELVQLFSNARLTLTWSNQSNNLHFISIEPVQSGDPIFPPGFPIPPATLKLVQSFRYISAPTTETFFSIPGLSLDTYGTYRAYVFRVNREYGELYNNQVQDSRDLNEPPSNIRNARGIFTAFAGDSVTFEVSKQ